MCDSLCSCLFLQNIFSSLLTSSKKHDGVFYVNFTILHIIFCIGKKETFTYNAHTRGVARVEKCHNVYPMQFIMVISVVKVVFLNGPSFSPSEPLKCQKMEFFQLWGQFWRSSRGHSEKWIAPLKSAYISGIIRIWNFSKKWISVFF